ncbi:MAG: biopolymer transporter ExbD [Candidatus Latescibacteria bacterium]|nr:biopolymer transporter ExbD [Candidatus Latescibacterota bacterium]NIO55404.1 biopolymer transporter ExbD [Candidatus Latescibacterota bacterium]
MAIADVASTRSRGEAQPWKRPRPGIRIDMTPMVDIAFLLLVFFMVTTVFRLPQAMEINLPPETEVPMELEVGESRLLTFRVIESDELFFNVGNDLPQPLPWDSLRVKLMERKAAVGFDSEGRSRLIIVARVCRLANYESMVNLIDEFNVAKTTRFSVDRYTAADDSVLHLADIPANCMALIAEGEEARATGGEAIDTE